jgi:hypothetical protein
MWKQLDNGETIGTKGSEAGIIVLDEEHDDGVRVTLERDGDTAPWSITCGIYGSFMHTAFASDEEEGRAKYDKMKSALIKIIQEHDADRRYQAMDDFANEY